MPVRLKSSKELNAATIVVEPDRHGLTFKDTSTVSPGGISLQGKAIKLPDSFDFVLFRNNLLVPFLQGLGHAWGLNPELALRQGLLCQRIGELDQDVA